MKKDNKKSLLTFISQVDDKKGLYKCECGQEKILHISKVKGGFTKSCGCLGRMSANVKVIEGSESRGRTYKRKDISGVRYGSLTAIKFSHYDTKCEVSVWLCKCDCGNETLVRLGALGNGRIRSCGCSHAERRLPHKNHPLYHILRSMKDRCSNPDVSNYHRYGGRGITVCEEWRHDYEAFYEYAIKLYIKGYQIDRIDNNGNYEPGNIRWVTNVVNMRNSSNAILTEEKVREIRLSTKKPKELALQYGVAKNTIYSILQGRNWKEV